MANSLNITTPIALEDGTGTRSFEVDWFDVNQLVSGEPLMTLDIPLFVDGFATAYFEVLWNGVAAKLSKDDLDINVKLVNDEGMATLEFEAYWEELIT